MTLPKTIAIGVVSAMFAAAPAFAGATYEEQSVPVSIAGYDLTSETGAKLVLEKIANAASQVCAADEQGRSLQERTFARDCMASAMKTAVSAVNQPVLTRVFTEARNRS